MDDKKPDSVSLFYFDRNMDMTSENILNLHGTANFVFSRHERDGAIICVRQAYKVFPHRVTEETDYRIAKAWIKHLLRNYFGEGIEIHEF